jgi:hypothetical protein
MKENKTRKTKCWMGTPPEKCDVCGQKFTDTFIDGKTRAGPWGMLCPGCFVRNGVGLGLGLGQQYHKETGNGGVEWIKVAG